MNGYEFYCQYMAIKLHFKSESYDYFKYNGKLKSANPASFEKRRDKFMFHKLSKRIEDNDVVPFLISNFISTKNMPWTKQLLEPTATNNLVEWKRKFESLDYIFKQDMNTITETGNITKMLESHTDGSYPDLFYMMMNNRISMETVIIINSMTGCVKHWDKQYSEDFIYSGLSNTIKKYSPFLHLDMENFKNIAKKCLTGR